MKTFAFLPAVSVFALAAGFTPVTFAQAPAPPEACYSENFACRNVKVTVEGNRIVVDPATVTVTGRASPVKIVWYLATPGYRFVDEPGSRPADIPGYTKGQFMSGDSRFCYIWRTGTVYVCTDRNDETVDASYTIKVQAASGSSPPPASGRVVNN